MQVTDGGVGGTAPLGRYRGRRTLVIWISGRTHTDGSHRSDTQVESRRSLQSCRRWTLKVKISLTEEGSIVFSFL